MKDLINKILSIWRESPTPAPTLEQVLTNSGWSRDRVCTEAVVAFEKAFPGCFHSKAREFVQSYGNLLLKNSLSTFCGDLEGYDHPLAKMRNFVGCEACPVGESNYWSSESILWIDEAGKFYVVDDGRIVFFIASSTLDAFEALFFGGRVSKTWCLTSNKMNPRANQ